MTWFNLSRHNKDNDRLVVNIHEQIGKNWWDDSGVTAKGFIDDLTTQAPFKSIELHINSPGGSVYDGVAIYNHLKRLDATVDVIIDGEASSIASVIAMAGDTITMPENALLMIHDPMRGIMGYLNASELRDIADRLDIVKSGIVSAYKAKTGLTAEKISELMTAETFMTADQAKELGFIDVIEGAANDVNHSDIGAIINSAQQEFKQRHELAITKAKLATANSEIERLKQPPEQCSAEDVLILCDKAGLSFMAADLVSRKLQKSDVEAAIADAAGLSNVLAAAGLQDSLQECIKLSKSDAIARVITDTKALLEPTIDSTLTPSQVSASTTKTFSPNAVYENRRKQQRQ